MIRVTCDACGAAFKARDELAGRRGKCPQCGEAIVVSSGDGASRAGDGGEAAGDDDDAAGVAPSSAPVASGGRRARSGVRPSGGSRGRGRGRARRSGGFNAGVVIVVVVAIVAAAAFWVVQGGGGAEDAYARGLDLLASARYDEAIAAFESVPSSSPVHPNAQEKLAEARALREGEESRLAQRGATSLYNVIQQVEKVYVKGYGPHDPLYAPNTRYLLKRIREFLDEYPDDPRAEEMEQLAYYYSSVASLDEPPTAADVEAELNFRLILQKPNLKAAAEAIDEFAAATTGTEEQVAAFRARVQETAQEYWAQIKGSLERDGSLDTGAENWQRVANQCQRYMDAVEGVSFVTPAPEAKQLLSRATGG